MIKKHQLEMRLKQLQHTIDSCETEMAEVADKLEKMEQKMTAIRSEPKTVGQLVTNVLAERDQFDKYKYYDRRKGGTIRLKVCNVYNPNQIVKDIQTHSKAAELGIAEVRVHRVYRGTKIKEAGEIVVFYRQPTK